jgi:hypothetical protein
MTTLQTLIDECEADLADGGNVYWTAADVERWLRDGIKDYSEHFPRTLTTTLLTVADDRTYDLPANCREVLAVEFPSGQTPPVFLQRRPYNHPQFWQENGYYDFVARLDDSDAPELWVSESPAGSMVGQTITVYYLGEHDAAIATGGTVTVPGRHQPILRAYVLWQAAGQRKAMQEANPTSNSSLLMSQLGVNTDRLRRAYIDRLAKAIQAEIRPGAFLSWADQNGELRRIY